jgi:type IV secretion system protein VirB5
MKKILLSSLVIASLLMSPSVLGAMAVVDFSAITQLKNQFDQLKKQYEQLDKQTGFLDKQFTEMQLQSGKMDTHLGKITGNRGYGNKHTKNTFDDNLPEQWETTYSNIRTQGDKALTGRAKKIYDDNRVFDACSVESKNAQEQQQCTAQGAKVAQDQAFALDMLETAQKRQSTIKSLMGEISETEDPKEIAELQARISVEMSAMEHDRLRLELFKLAAEAEDRLQEQRQRELNAKTWSTRNMD